MKPKNCLIFGASGFIGRNLIRKLTQNNFKVIAVTRNLHQRGHVLKTQGNLGYIDIIETSIFNETKIRDLVKNSDICINLTGILYQEGKINTFKNIHEKFPSFLSKLCNEYNIEQFVHLSALGIENATNSLYAKSKLNGENFVRENFNATTILKPSIVYGNSPDDFSNKFMRLLNILPVFPLYYSGKTLFTPIFVNDLIDIIYQVIQKGIKSTTIECIGKEEISLKNILLRLLKLIGKKRLLLPIPFFIAKLSANFFQLFSKPLLTIDQLSLLKNNNVSSGKYKTNFELGLPSKANFDAEIKKYSWMYSDRGEFSQEKYKKSN